MASLHCLNEQQEAQVDMVTERIIGLAIEVHRALGPGLLEPTYAAALRIEFDGARMSYQNQLRVTDKPVGLSINFNSRLVTEGVKRLVL